MDPRWARPWFAATAACVVAGIVIQLFVSAADESYFGGSALGRAGNVFAFFTIQSNVLVGVACALLALDPRRGSTAFAVLRLTGVVAITLSRLLDLDTWAQAANQLQHTVVPVLAVVGWVAFGPRGRTSARVVRLTCLFPAAYMVFTAVRGPLASDWYPYPFVDVDRLGYVRVAINAAWIALLFVSLAAGTHALERRLEAPALPERT